MNADAFGTLRSFPASTVNHDVNPQSDKNKKHRRESPTVERRERSRNVSFRRTYIEAGCLVLECNILDLSRAGVRLRTDASGIIPEEFDLRISGSENPLRACKVVWRQGDEIGVRFLCPE
ncbi:MAG: PilZ domain-containing protein [Pseudorhodoplanes sp.]